MTPALFNAQNLNLSFGGVKAVRDVSFEVKSGEVFSIIGPNGAGKTTILNLISRLYDMESGGTMSIEGNDISGIPAWKVARHGIARTFQNTELFEHDTVLNNLLIGRHTHRKTHLFAETLFLPSVREQELAFPAACRRRHRPAGFTTISTQTHSWPALWRAETGGGWTRALHVSETLVAG